MILCLERNLGARRQMRRFADEPTLPLTMMAIASERFTGLLAMSAIMADMRRRRTITGRSATRINASSPATARARGLRRRHYCRSMLMKIRWAVLRFNAARLATEHGHIYVHVVAST